MISAVAAKSAAYADDAAEAAPLRADREHTKYERLIAAARAIPPIPTAVVWPCEAHALAVGPRGAASAASSAYAALLAATAEIT